MGSVVFCQQALLEKPLKQSKGKVANSIGLMINDARDRKLIYDDYVQESSSEEGNVMRQQWNALSIQQAREKQMGNDLDLINKINASTQEAEAGDFGRYMGIGAASFEQYILVIGSKCSER